MSSRATSRWARPASYATHLQPARHRAPATARGALQTSSRLAVLDSWLRMRREYGDLQTALERAFFRSGDFAMRGFAQKAA